MSKTITLEHDSIYSIYRFSFPCPHCGKYMGFEVDDDGNYEDSFAECLHTIEPIGFEWPEGGGAPKVTVEVVENER